MGTKHEGREKTDSEEVAPTITQGGVMPGGSEMSVNANPYPRADASNPGSLPDAIEDSVGDPTGNKGWGPLYELAVEQGIAGADTMTRAELAHELNATMAPEDVADRLDNRLTPEELLAATKGE